MSLEAHQHLDQGQIAVGVLTKRAHRSIRRFEIAKAGADVRRAERVGEVGVLQLGVGPSTARRSASRCHEAISARTAAGSLSSPIERLREVGRAS